MIELYDAWTNAQYLPIAQNRRQIEGHFSSLEFGVERAWNCSCYSQSLSELSRPPNLPCKVEESSFVVSLVLPDYSWVTYDRLISIPFIYMIWMSPSILKARRVKTCLGLSQLGFQSSNVHPLSCEHCLCACSMPMTNTMYCGLFTSCSAAGGTELNCWAVGSVAKLMNGNNNCVVTLTEGRGATIFFWTAWAFLKQPHLPSWGLTSWRSPGTRELNCFPVKLFQTSSGNKHNVLQWLIDGNRPQEQTELFCNRTSNAFSEDVTSIVLFLFAYLLLSDHITSYRNHGYCFFCFLSWNASDPRSLLYESKLSVSSLLQRKWNLNILIAVVFRGGLGCKQSQGMTGTVQTQKTRQALSSPLRWTAQEFYQPQQFKDCESGSYKFRLQL